MKLTDEELSAAKRQLLRVSERLANSKRLNDPSLSAEDRELVRKYPRHTLEAARLIEATPCRNGIPGNRDSHYLIRKQETHCLQINGDHT